MLELTFANLQFIIRKFAASILLLIKGTARHFPGHVTVEYLKPGPIRVSQ